VLGLGKVLYDHPQQPPIPEGWIFRTLVAFAALMRSTGALVAMVTSAILLHLVIERWYFLIPMPRVLAINLLRSIPELIMGLVISWLLLRFAHRARLGDLGLPLNRSAIAETLFSILGGGLMVALIVAPLLLMGMGEFSSAETKIRGPYGLVVLTGLMFIAAFSEELILRGYVFQTLVQPVHMLGAVVITSTPFAILHWSNPGADEYSMMNTFLAGATLAMLMAWRRSLWAAAGAHFGWNFATVLFGLNVSGISIPLVPFTINWKADKIWTGGSYGPEGGLPCTVLLSALLLVLIRLYYHREEGSRFA
jgi:membrane protease YdiL (CAAX protease family)